VLYGPSLPLDRIAADADMLPAEYHGFLACMPMRSGSRDTWNHGSSRSLPHRERGNRLKRALDLPITL
jgi:hypothetical protein